MDISKMRPVRISQFASAKVMVDHFPTIDAEAMFNEFDLDLRDLSMNAGALCLYAATLLGQVHENMTEEIEFESTEREQELRSLIKLNPKYSSFSEEQVSQMAHNLILKDIRNSFAHGNFEIDYDVYSKRLNYVLKPHRKDFVVDKPIIISREALLKVNRQELRHKATPYKLMSPNQLLESMLTNHGEQVKNFLLMSDILRMAENYLDTKLKHYEKFKPAERCYTVDYYALLVSQLTYEQNDYYNLFNKDSNIFKQIAYMRNTMVHGGYELEYDFYAKTPPEITYTDRDNVKTETLGKTVATLRVLRECKWMIDFFKNKQGTDKYTQSVVENAKMAFDKLFIYDNEFGEGLLDELANDFQKL